MEFLGFLGAYIFGFLLNTVLTPLIIGMWLVLFIRFGLLPQLLEQSKMTTEERKHVIRSVTRVILGIGLIGIPLTLFLCCNIELIGEVWYWVEGTLDEIMANVIGTVLFGVVRIVIVVEEWLALISFFGLYYVSNRLGLPIDQRQKITRYFAITILIMGIATVLAGLGWSIYTYTAPVDWGRLEETGFVVGIALGPFTGLLTIGMLVMLVISLVQAMRIEEGDGQRERLARNMTLALLITFVLLSTVGSIWSASIHRLWKAGRLF